MRFKCCFCLEKRPINNIEGYVLHISPIKHAKTDSSKTYFDLSFQTDNKNVRAVCFSPEKWQRLKKYQEDSTGCVISSVVQDSYKTNELKLTNFSTIKPKTLVFSKEANYQFNSFDEIINEFQLLVRIVHGGDIKTTSNNLTLKEYIATDGGKFQMKIAMFEQFADQMELNNTCKILNLQLVTYLKERKLKSTTLTKVDKIDKDIPDLKMKECPKVDQREIVIVDNIDNNSLLEHISCFKCSASFVKTDKKLVTCTNCGGVQLSKTCVSKNVLKLSKSSNTYICNWDILSEILLSDITIGQNEDFILYMLSNKFVINHVNNEIHSIELEK